MDNQLKNVLDIYKQLTTTTQLLQNGKEFLDNQIARNQEFCSQSCKLLVSNDYCDIIMRRHIGVLLKNYIHDEWSNNRFHSKEKKEIREILLHGIVMNTEEIRIIETISLIIAELISKDGVDMWSNPLKELISWIQTQNSKIIDTGLEFFCTIFSNLEDKLVVIVPQIMPALFQVFAQPELKEPQREQLLVLLFMAIQTFSGQDGQNNQLVSQCFDETYEIWMSLFIQALSSSPKSLINIKRYILKILTLVFRDMTYYSRKSIATSLLPIWKFFNQIIPLFVWNAVYEVPIENLDENLNLKCDISKIKQQNDMQNEQQNKKMSLDFRFLNQEEECESDIEALALQTIEMVATLITKESLYIIIKFSIFPIINALAHYMLLTRYQERQWRFDPNQFISDDEDEASMRSIRALSTKLIFDLIEKFGDQATQALMIVSEKFLMNFDEKHTMNVIKDFFSKMNFSDVKNSYFPDMTKDKLMQLVKSSNFDCDLQDHAWKKKEVGLFLLGSFADDVIFFQQKHKSSLNISQMIQNLIQEIDNQNSLPINVSKAIWTISRFSEVIATDNKQLFLPLFKVCQNSLDKSKEFPVRMTACKALSQFANKITQYRQELLKDKESIQKYGIENTDSLIDIFEIMQYTTEETLYIVLDSLVALNKLSLLYPPIIAELGSKSLLHIFTMFNGDPLIGRSINELIMQLSNHKQAFPTIYNDFSPFILDCFTFFQNHLQNNQDLSLFKEDQMRLMSSIFDITTIFVGCCTDYKESEQLMKLLGPLIQLMLVNDDANLQIHASVCLKQFIKVAFAHIIKQGQVNDVKQVISKLLQIQQNSANERASLYSGNLAMISFNNLFNGVADQQILKEVVQKLLRSRMPSIVQGLVLVYARMVNNNPSDTLNFLTSFSIDNKMALKVLIDKWLLQQPIFRGKYTKNCTYTALAKLFNLKDKRLENLLVIPYNPSHQNVGNDVSAPLKIFSTMIRGLDNEMAPSRKDKDLVKEALNVIGNNNKKQNNIPNSYYDNDDGRLDTLEDEDYGPVGDFKDEIEVDIPVIVDDDNDADIIKRFNQQEKKGRGLQDIETGSTNYMTEGLAFGFDDGDECDETTEEDLVYLKDSCINMNTSDIIKNFFNDLTKDDPDYFHACTKSLLKEDVVLLQKYIKVKNNQQSGNNYQNFNSNVQKA